MKGARETLSMLAEVGIDLNQVTDDLLAAGLKGFVEPFEKLIKTIEEKREATISSIVERQSLSLGQYKQAVLETIKDMDQQQFIRRLWRKDLSLWKDDPEHQEIIRHSLGWLTVAGTSLENAEELRAFADRVRGGWFRSRHGAGYGVAVACARKCCGEPSGGSKGIHSFWFWIAPIRPRSEVWKRPLMFPRLCSSWPVSREPRRSP